MKILFLIILLTPSISEDVKEVKKRISELSYQLDNFELAFYQLRRFRDDIVKNEKAVRRLYTDLALLGAVMQRERREIENRMERLLSYILKVRFMRRRVPYSARELITYAVADYMERKVIKKTRDYFAVLVDFTSIASKLENVYSDTREILNSLDESNWMLSQILSILILERRDALRALRKEAIALLNTRPDISKMMVKGMEKGERRTNDFILPLSLIDIIGVKNLGPGVFFYSIERKKVRAVKGGRIVYAGWLRGYGNTVIMKHNGYYSVYAHLRSIYVKPDVNLLIGDEIGEVGDTSSLYGTGLYFELRYGKKVINVKSVYKNLWKEVEEK